MWLPFWKYKDLMSTASKFRSMKKNMEKIVVRAKEWTCLNSNWEEQWAVVVEITWDMKIRDIKINDDSLLNPSNKSKLEELLMAVIQKWFTKVWEVVAEKNKDLLWWIDAGSLSEMLWWMWS